METGKADQYQRVEQSPVEAVMKNQEIFVKENTKRSRSIRILLGLNQKINGRKPDLTKSAIRD